MPSLLFCGPKLAACGIVLSIWGVVMLVSAGLHLRANDRYPSAVFVLYFLNKRLCDTETVLYYPGHVGDLLQCQIRGADRGRAVY